MSFSRNQNFINALSKLNLKIQIEHINQCEKNGKLLWQKQKILQNGTLGFRIHKIGEKNQQGGKEKREMRFRRNDRGKERQE